MRIGWIGTGVMGRSMAGHVQAAGHELYVHNRTKV
ncbi:MAG: NAD(P)-binding domain-containing protein, partial [Deltaproteobacteria bacterium]|nr:NAD(P)-binding domain-containing protein [Deltaproteobacteria bacterium]